MQHIVKHICAPSDRIPSPHFEPPPLSLGYGLFLEAHTAVPWISLGCHGYNSSLTSSLPFPTGDSRLAFKTPRIFENPFDIQPSLMTNIYLDIYKNVSASQSCQTAVCHLWFAELLNDGSLAKSLFLADHQIPWLTAQNSSKGQWSCGLPMYFLLWPYDEVWKTIYFFLFFHKEYFQINDTQQAGFRLS